LIEFALVLIGVKAAEKADVCAGFRPAAFVA
jgi:hypothetical protein